MRCENCIKHYEVKPTYPSLSIQRAKIIKDTGVPFSEYPLLRPFDKYILSGGEIGKITYIFLKHHFKDRYAIIGSICQTRDRILLFPSWGITPMIPSFSQDSKPCPINHLTIEKRNGKITIHYTGPQKGTTKIKNYPTYTPSRKNSNFFVIGIMGVNHPENIDHIAKVYREVPNKRFTNMKIIDIEKEMQSALRDIHPVLEEPISRSPVYINWNSENHLETLFGLIPDRTKDYVPFKDTITQQVSNSAVTNYQIDLDDNNSIYISLKLCWKKFPKSIQWGASK